MQDNIRLLLIRLTTHSKYLNMSHLMKNLIDQMMVFTSMVCSLMEEDGIAIQLSLKNNSLVDCSTQCQLFTSSLLTQKLRTMMLPQRMYKFTRLLYTKQQIEKESCQLLANLQIIFQIYMFLHRNLHLTGHIEPLLLFACYQTELM